MCSSKPLVYYLLVYRRGAYSPSDELLLSVFVVTSLASYFGVFACKTRPRIRDIDCRALVIFPPVVNRLDLYGKFLNLTNRG